MTIQTTANKASGLGNGLTTNFNFNFLVPLATQMSVLLTDTTVTPPTTVTLDPATYNITGLGNPLGGTVTYPLIGPALVNGQNLTMIRTLPLSQLSSIRNQNGWYPGTVEDALDYLTMITQQLQEVMQRAFALATTDISGASTVLATPVPGGVIAWDVTGLKLTNVALAAAGAAIFPLNTGMAVYTGGNVFGNCVTLTAGAGLQINNGNGIAGNPTFLIPANAITASMIPANIVIALGIGSTAGSLAVAGAFAANGTATLSADAKAALQAVPLRNITKHIFGFTYANNGTDNLDIAAGGATDAAGAYFLTGAALTKQTNVAWAVGTAAGMLDTGAVGNSDYYIWAIARPDTGVVDYLSSLSSTAPTMPANYTVKRLIGWFKRVAGVVVAFHTYEGEGGGLVFRWDLPTTDVSLLNTLTTARRTDAIKVPLNFSVTAQVIVQLIDAASNFFAWWGCPDTTDFAPGASPPSNFACTGSLGVTYDIRSDVITSAAGLMAARASIATVDSYIVSTEGFKWARRN